MADITGEQVVVVRRAPRGLQDRERLTAKVFALSPALGRPEQRRQARRHSGRHEHLPHLPPTRLGREPREPGRQLAVALPDHLRVVRREETAEVPVHAFDAPELAVERHGQRGLAVAHSVRFQLDQCLAQPVGLRRRCRVDHRGGRALRLLHVRHHRVTAREVVALCAPDPAPRRLHRPGPPLERHRHRRIQAVELPEQVRVGLAGRGQKRVQDHGLAVEPQVTALRLEFREGESPVHPASRRSVPDHARTVDQLGEKPGRLGGLEHLDRRVLRYERPARVHRRAKAGGGGLDLGTEVGRCARPAALPPLHDPGGASCSGPVCHRP